MFEQLFFAKNVTTAFTVGAARGVAIARCARYTESLYEYTPMQIKQAVTGYGKAEKQQIQRMTQLMLELRTSSGLTTPLTRWPPCHHYRSGRFGDLHILK